MEISGELVLLILGDTGAVSKPVFLVMSGAFMITFFGRLFSYSGNDVLNVIRFLVFETAEFTSVDRCYGDVIVSS